MSKLFISRGITLHSQAAESVQAARLVALDAAREALGPHGFLPGRAPAPPQLAGLGELGDELPRRYHALAPGPQPAGRSSTRQLCRTM